MSRAGEKDKGEQKQEQEQKERRGEERRRRRGGDGRVNGGLMLILGTRDRSSGNR